MKYQMRILQGWKLAAVVAVALSMGACAKNNIGPEGAMASAATPGVAIASEPAFDLMVTGSKSTRNPSRTSRTP